DAKFYGGDTNFTYSLKPLGSRTRPTSRFEVDVAGADLNRFTEFLQLPGLRFAGTARWHNVLEWPIGQFRAHAGDGHLVVSPPPGAAPMPASLVASRIDAERNGHEWGPFAPAPLASHL